MISLELMEPTQFTSTSIFAVIASGALSGSSRFPHRLPGSQNRRSGKGHAGSSSGRRTFGICGKGGRSSVPADRPVGWTAQRSSARSMPFFSRQRPRYASRISPIRSTSWLSQSSFRKFCMAGGKIRTMAACFSFKEVTGLDNTCRNAAPGRTARPSHPPPRRGWKAHRARWRN